MTITAHIVADSQSAVTGARITTFCLFYPRWLHPEALTHREFSRNSSSSRAIPIKKLSDSIMRDPSMPISFRKNQAGMQSAGELPEWKQQLCRSLWRLKARIDVTFATVFSKLGVSKETANRLQENSGHITVVVSSTGYSNFFALRCHKDAQPEIRALATLMRELYRTSVPTKLAVGQWHLPFVSKQEQDAYWASLGKGVVGSMAAASWLPLIKRSVARCARTSYMAHDGGSTNTRADEALHDKLVGSTPRHCSPAEHQATPMKEPWGRSGNLVGFEQYRKSLPGEYIKEYEWRTIDAENS